MDSNPLKPEEVRTHALFGANGDWLAIAKGLLAEKRIGMGVLAAARIASARGDATPLQSLLGSTAKKLDAETAKQTYLMVRDMGHEDEDKIAVLSAAIVNGALPYMCLRAIASELDGMGSRFVPAAADFVNAAQLLAAKLDPEYAKTLGFIKGLIEINRGRPERALAEAQACEEAAPEQAKVLRDYAKGLFPAAWDFWPARERISGEAQPVAMRRSLADVQNIAQQYATRLRGMRREMAKSGSFAWLPPDLPQLLPKGEVALLEPLDVDGLGIADVMRRVRADWASLCWLLWSAGAREMKLPSAIAPPPEFANAVTMIQERLNLFEAVEGESYDGEPADFTWMGMKPEELPGNVAAVAKEEYLGVFNLLIWTMDPATKNPWRAEDESNALGEEDESEDDDEAEEGAGDDGPHPTVRTLDDYVEFTRMLQGGKMNDALSKFRLQMQDVATVSQAWGAAMMSDPQLAQAFSRKLTGAP